MKERVSRFYQKHRKYLVLLLVLLVLAVVLRGIYSVVLFPNMVGKLYTSVGAYNRADTVTLQEDRVLEQSFVAKDGLDAVLLFCQQAEEPISDGTLTMELLDQDGTLLDHVELHDAALSETTLKFPLSQAVAGARGKTYTLRFSIEGEAALTLLCSSSDVYTEGTLTQNGEALDADLTFSVQSGCMAMLKRLYLLFSVFILVGTAVMYWLTLIKKVKLQQVMLAAVLILGTLMAGLIPPFAVADEEAHFQTAYRYSNVILFAAPYSTENGNMMMRASDTMRTSIYNPPNDANYSAATFSKWAAAANGLFSVCEDDTLVEVSGQSVGNVAQYFPAALGIAVARLLHLGFIPMLYMGRLFNFLFFLLLAWFAVKIIPFAKPMMVAICMLAMTLHQAISFSYDAVVNALAFLFIALCLYVIYDQKPRLRAALAALCVSGALLAAAKAGVYIFIGALLLLLLGKKSLSGKQRWLFVAAVCAAMVASIVFFNLTKVMGTVTKETVETGSGNYTFSYILENPKDFLRMVFRTIYSLKSFYLQSMIGSQLCWLNVSTAPIYVLLSAVMLTLCSMQREDEAVTLRGREKWLMGTIVAVILLVLLAVSLTWTGQGGNTIQGVQGRYFLPCLPLIMLVFRTPKLTMKAGTERTLLMGQYSVTLLLLVNLFVTIA